MPSVILSVTSSSARPPHREPAPSTTKLSSRQYQIATQRTDAELSTPPPARILSRPPFPQGPGQPIPRPIGPDVGVRLTGRLGDGCAIAVRSPLRIERVWRLEPG